VIRPASCCAYFDAIDLQKLSVDRSLPKSRNGAIPRYHLAMPTRKADARTYPTITRAEAEAWRDLHRQLARTRTLQDAKDIAAQAAPPHAKRFYAHLRSFVRTLKSPRRGTRSELYVYRKLRLRFANIGQPPANARNGAHTTRP
jgi:hypothetical protein